MVGCAKLHDYVGWDVTDEVLYATLALDADEEISNDLEEEIRSLQLDTAENNEMPSTEYAQPEEQKLDKMEEEGLSGGHSAEHVKQEEVELMDKMEEDVKGEIHTGSQSVQVEQRVKEREPAPVQIEDELMEENKKRHLNVVFIGHVDAGKSTTGGQILFLSGQVDDRTIQKYEKEAKDKSRESWYMAYIMDTNEEERVKGKTIEVGRAHFETETTRFTILDAPGHKSYVPNMISGASQADIGVLVISARKGEFETGYERGGQTREHVQLAKTLGVSKLLVVVNKMDDPTVCWSKERYDEIEGKMIPFLKSSGYNVKKDVLFLPISGLLGSNMKTRVDKSVCSWWDGPCLFEALDAVEVPPRDPRGPFRLPIIDKFKDMGTVVMGKIESGSVRDGDALWVMPNKVQVKVIAVYCDENKVRVAGPGENVRIRVSGIEEDDILSGFVLSSIARPVPAVSEFVAQLQILELLENAIFTAGYKAVLHIHAVVEECEIIELLQQIDPKTRRPIKRKVLFVKNGAVVVCRIQVNNLICIEKFSEFAQLGRFTLRTEGKTVAVGKVTDLPSPASSSMA
ncbi:Translational (tr)-type GTP-binding domain [Dillenia turbinata]|uniref:Translational (Tr)-type GTP-binding domain n=1 Tax=Dillenia turbinata TaxID=194707 RepID=A0AAN8W901_9MAGN